MQVGWINIPRQHTLRPPQSSCRAWCIDTCRRRVSPYDHLSNSWNNRNIIIQFICPLNGRPPLNHHNGILQAWICTDLQLFLPRFRHSAHAPISNLLPNRVKKSTDLRIDYLPFPWIMSSRKNQARQRSNMILTRDFTSTDPKRDCN